MSSDITGFYSVIDHMVTTNQGNTTGPPVEHDCFSSKYLNSYCSLDYSTGKLICHVIEPMITREIPFIDEYFPNIIINDDEKDENDEQDEDDQIFPHHFFLQTNQQTIVLLPLVKEHVFLGEKKTIGKLVVLLEKGLNRLVLTQQIVAKELEEENNNNNNQHIDEDIDSFSVLWIGFNRKLRRILDLSESTIAAAYNYANRKYDANLNSNYFHWQLGLCKNITKKKNYNEARILNFIPTQWG